MSVGGNDMIRRKEDVRIRKVVNAQGGKGELYFEDWLLPEEAPGHGRVFSKVVIPPGCSIGYHQHQGEFEAFLVLEGIGLVNDNGTESELHTGDMNLCKNGDYHGIENIGEDNLVLQALIMNQLEQ